jgi:hypothetical protein
MGKCMNCGIEADLIWVNDPYGIPYAKVCYKCEEQVSAEIAGYEFDETYAGEHLYEDY